MEREMICQANTYQEIGQNAFVKQTAPGQPLVA
jgi:hypothetical protein